jgi:glutathione S-transferase
VPCLTHDGAKVWNTLAIAQYLDEVRPEAGLLPDDRIARAHCRSVCGEMNSGFANLRSALPMNLKARHPGYKVWAGAQPDIDRIVEIWTECLRRYGGPWLFGKRRTMADAMFAPVATRFLTYDVKLSKPCIAYCQTVMAMPEMQEWVAAAQAEPDDIEELDMDFWTRRRAGAVAAGRHQGVGIGHRAVPACRRCEVGRADDSRYSMSGE